MSSFCHAMIVCMLQLNYGICAEMNSRHAGKNRNPSNCSSLGRPTIIHQTVAISTHE